MNRLADFFEAIQNGDDDAAEILAEQLSTAEEAELLAALDKESDENNRDERSKDKRWWTIRALALIGTARSLEKIVSALDDSDPLLRCAALLALAAIHTRQPDVVRPYLAIMAQRLTDDDGMVRQSASDALAQCGNDAVPALTDVIRGDHQGARTRAAQALRQIKTMPAAAVLYRCLNDENYMVHTYAYEGLDEMGLLETMLLAP